MKLQSLHTCILGLGALAAWGCGSRVAEDAEIGAASSRLAAWARGSMSQLLRVNAGETKVRSVCELTVPLATFKPLTFSASGTFGEAPALSWTGIAVSSGRLSVSGCSSYPCDVVATYRGTSASGANNACQISADDGVSRLIGDSSGNSMTVPGAPSAPVIFNQGVKLGAPGTPLHGSCVFRQNARSFLAQVSDFAVSVNGAGGLSPQPAISIGNVAWQANGPAIDFGLLYIGAEPTSTRLTHVTPRTEMLMEGDALRCQGRFNASASANVFDVNVTGTRTGTGMSLVSAPTAWTCDASLFGTGNGCDCECGIADPDCDASGPNSCSACVPDTSNLVNEDAWICAADTEIQMQGAWYGFGDGASCTPPANVCASGNCCMSGVTISDPTYQYWGCGLGMQLNATDGPTPVNSAYTGPVDCFDITLAGSSGSNPLRIGFTQNTSEMIAPYVQIPAFSDGWSGRVCFNDVSCPDWTDPSTCNVTGTPYDLQLLIVSDSRTVSPFNVCVTSVVPVIDPGGSGTTPSCSTVSGAGTITDLYGTAHVSCNEKDYIVQNNAWGSTAGQTITYGPGTKFKVTVQNGTGSAWGAPASYPSLFIGANGGRMTANSGLPKSVSAIGPGSVPTSWTWTANGATGTYNAAYDVWFSATAAGDPDSYTPSGGYLMVWFYDPPNTQPIGSAVSAASIGGRGWTIWHGLNGDKPVVSYVAQQSINSLTFSLGDFIQDAIARGYVQQHWYLTNVFAGFEIWSGGVGLETTDFFVNP